MSTSWKSAPLKRACRINRITIGEDTPTDWKMQYLDISAVDSEGNVGTLETHTFASAPSRARRLVQSGDTVISTVRTYLKAIAHFEQPPANLIASTGFAVLSPTLELDSRFLWRAVQDHNFVGQVVANSEGVGYPAIAPSRLANLLISFPTLDEQRRIAAYLDEQTEKIDRLMDMRRRQMALLKEQRSALIQQAVTRGLNPNVLMKDFGLPWLGEIPEHWTLTRFRYLGNFIGGGTPSKANADYWEGGTIPWVSPKDMKSNVIADTEDHITEFGLQNSPCQLVPPGALLMVVRSGILRNKLPVARNAVPVTLNQDMRALFPIASVFTQFIQYFVHGCEAELLSHWCKDGSTVESIEHDILAGTWLALPPTPEQRRIVAYLDEQTAKLDSLRDFYDRQLTLLTEYRAALIHECVTGQRQIPEVANP